MDYGRTTAHVIIAIAVGCGGTTLPDDGTSQTGGTAAMGGAGTTGMTGQGGKKGGSTGAGGTRSAGGSAGLGGKAQGGSTSAGGSTGLGGVPNKGGAHGLGGTKVRGFGGTIHTGGAYGLGGTTYTGGSGVGGGDPLDCEDNVTFVMVTGTPHCDGAAGCSNGGWLAVISDSGAIVQTSSMCTTTCGQCEELDCALMCRPSERIPSTGVTQTWTGRVFEFSTCATGSSAGTRTIRCAEPTCAVAGQYVARMCAYPDLATDGGTCQSSSTPDCVDVPFEYPGTTVVKGYVGTTR